MQLDGETAELLGASLEGDTLAVDIGDLITDARSGGRSLSHLVRLRAGHRETATWLALVHVAMQAHQRLQLAAEMPAMLVVLVASVCAIGCRGEPLPSCAVWCPRCARPDSASTKPFSRLSSLRQFWRHAEWRAVPQPQPTSVARK